MRRVLMAYVPSVLIAGAVLSVATAVVATPIATDSPSLLLTFLANLSYWLLWSALAPAALYLGVRFRIVAGAWLRNVAIHAVAGVVFAAIHLVCAMLALDALRWWLLHAPFRTEFQAQLAPIRLHVEWEITMYWALVGLAHALAFRHEAQERAIRAVQLEARLAQAQLQALQRQLQPHFLFNSLHTIAALVHRDVAAADRMIERLGDLLRMTLAAGDLPEVSLAREIEHVRHYAAIEQANMGARLALSIDVEPRALAAAVPALLLQPLVENAVRHGLAPRAAGGHVRIAAFLAGDMLEVRVQDDGVGMRDGGATIGGIGVENTRQRLHQMYGERHRFTIESPADGGVVVSIQVPFRRVADPVTLEATR